MFRRKTKHRKEFLKLVNSLKSSSSDEETDLDENIDVKKKGMIF